MTFVRTDRAGQRPGLPRPSSELQFEAWAAREVPPSEEIRPGIWSMPLPLPPGTPMGYVNSYVFAGASKLTIVDPGWDFAGGRDAIGRGLAHVGAEVGDIAQVLVTHFHADHYGAAPWIRDVAGATIGMHREDSAVFDPVAESTDDRLASIEQFLLVSGAPADEIELLGQERGIIDLLRRVPGPDASLPNGTVLEAGDVHVEVLHTPGHTPGHVCFYVPEEFLLLSGDHILPRVSPNVSSYRYDDDDPLGDYLSSLELVRQRPVWEVLPGHEYRFDNLGGRLGQLESHHSARLDEVLTLLRGGGEMTSWALARELRWSRSWEDMTPYARRSANGETLAHLVLMERQGRVTGAMGSTVTWAVSTGDAQVTA